jgi:hypothetical protein
MVRNYFNTQKHKIAAQNPVILKSRRGEKNQVFLKSRNDKIMRDRKSLSLRELTPVLKLRSLQPLL